MSILTVKLHRRGDAATWAPVADVADACRAVRAFIESEGIGASEWNGGELKRDGKPCGVVNYNGTLRA